MEGFTVIRVVRQVTVRYASINDEEEGTTAPREQQPLRSREPPRAQSYRNSRHLNFCVWCIMYFVGIGSIVMGSLYLDECKAQRMIPICLISFGVVLMVSRLLNCSYDCRGMCEEYCFEETPPDLVLINLLFRLTEFGIFIALCCYTFSVHPTTHVFPNATTISPISPTMIDEAEDYHLDCDYRLYQTSFYGCIVGLVFYGLMILLIAVWVTRKRKQKNEAQ